MKIDFDQQADALYIQFQTSKVKHTVKMRDGILFDIDNKGRLFGIEILDVSQRIPIKELGHLNINLPVHV
ncbi:MAG: DUF2283 domain-containing protein [Candidatus Omnitrophica bacterium]|nr:DUF2283 domain-containing protein [Candidatus Omnitrophota bacterium]